MCFHATSRIFGSKDTDNEFICHPFSHLNNSWYHEIANDHSSPRSVSGQLKVALLSGELCVADLEILQSTRRLT